MTYPLLILLFFAPSPIQREDVRPGYYRMTWGACWSPLRYHLHLKDNGTYVMLWEDHTPSNYQYGRWWWNRRNRTFTFSEFNTSYEVVWTWTVYMPETTEGYIITSRFEGYKVKLIRDPTSRDHLPP